MTAELDTLNARREPARDAGSGPAARRRRRPTPSATEPPKRWPSSPNAYGAAHREIEGLEADVEAARSEVFSSINSATALRHSLEHAAVARDRVAETMAKLAVETEDVRIESRTRRRRPRSGLRGPAPGAGGHRGDAHRARWRASRSWPARASSTSGARGRSASRSRSSRASRRGSSRSQELEAARAEYGDAARAVLAQANGKVGQRGAVADYLDVEAGYERAVEACLGDLLQHVIVEEPEQAAAGFQLVRDAARRAVRIPDQRTPTWRPASDDADPTRRTPSAPEGLIALSSVVKVNGPYAGAIRQAIGEAWIADSYDQRRAGEPDRRRADRDDGRRRVPRAASCERRQPVTRRAGFSKPSARSRTSRSRSPPDADALAPLWPRKPPASRRPLLEPPAPSRPSTPSTTSRRRPSSDSTRSCSAGSTSASGWRRRASSWRSSARQARRGARQPRRAAGSRRAPPSRGWRTTSAPPTSA